MHDDGASCLPSSGSTKRAGHAPGLGSGRSDMMRSWRSRRADPRSGEHDTRLYESRPARRHGVAGRPARRSRSASFRHHRAPASRSTSDLPHRERKGRLRQGPHTHRWLSRPGRRAVGPVQQLELHDAAPRAAGARSLRSRTWHGHPSRALQHESRHVGHTHVVDAAGLRLRPGRRAGRRLAQVDGRGGAPYASSPAVTRAPPSRRVRAPSSGQIGTRCSGRSGIRRWPR